MGIKRVLSILVFLLPIIVWFVYASKHQSRNVATDEHTQWIAQSIVEIQHVKAGMTREELLKTFTTEGGISNRLHRVYVYRGCPYIKVKVEFSPIGKAGNFIDEKLEDKIKSISEPFLQFTISD